MISADAEREHLLQQFRRVAALARSVDERMTYAVALKDFAAA